LTSAKFLVKFLKMAKLHHVISADQFNPEISEKIFEEAERIRGADENSLKDILKNKSIVLLFWESSTRTFLSFYNAILKLGGFPIPILNAGKFSSAIKGESLKDTIRTCADLKADGIIMRHDKEGSAKVAAETLDIYAPKVCLLNAGDGKGEHPTQMLLDVYTLWRMKKEELKKGKLTGALVGDLRDSRVLHSDAKALLKYKTRLILISEKGNDLPPEITAEIKKEKIDYVRTDDIEKFAQEVDFWIFTRLQLERKGISLKNFRPQLQSKFSQKFGITKELLSKMKKDALLLHPLPRVEEIPEWVDEDKRAIYLSGKENSESQVANGLYLRMALLKIIF
jgi:aspartate carbamoyltransferase catalytic subunit